MTPIGGDGSKCRWELASGPKGKRLGTFDFVAVAHNGKVRGAPPVPRGAPTGLAPRRNSRARSSARSASAPA